jgi:hypothetical protein
MLNKPVAYFGQAVTYGLFAAFIGYFSTLPKYQHLAPDEALLKVSFTHYGQIKEACHQRTPAELAKLPPNMRAPMECVRERSPVTVRVDMDGNLLYQEALKPAGLHNDSASTVYRRFPVKAGSHKLLVQLNDSVLINGFNFVREETVNIQPGKVMLIDFDPAKGKILIR